MKPGFRIGTAVVLLTLLVPTANARKKEPEFATSANDPVLRARIAALSPTVDPEEAARVAAIAFTIGRELRKEWRMVWPPGLHTFLVNTGQRKGGLCFQFAERLLWRLGEQKWATLEFHWAEAYETSVSEHNVIVVTARGQHFSRGIILDNWRYGGRLVWGAVVDDPHYQWHENKRQFVYVLNKKGLADPSMTPAPQPKVQATTRSEQTSSPGSE
jgi:hypothetical protein